MNRHSIHQHLRSHLQSAIKNAFPRFELPSDIITFTFNGNNERGDLSTPVACRIASITGVDRDVSCRKIVSGFDWDSSFVKLDHPLQSTIKNGFINFFISTPFLLNNLRSVSKGFPFLTSGLPGVLESTTGILKNFFSDPQNEQKLKSARLDLLKSPLEVKLLKLVAVSGKDGLHSPEAVSYFIKRIDSSFGQYFRNCPIYTCDEDLTLSRILLTRAVHNHLYCLINNFSDF